ncbi:GDSL esterase/lipase At1g09390 [Carica papaya]|uniref:GDSL esterase/lipase At1g09390 n=1 Tax=Carica papaya TaxID=3649 RepID=UPI000B8C78D3|nr:GDSL esterase/lipase At1g09390 [Carica papaya]
MVTNLHTLSTMATHSSFLPQIFLIFSFLAYSVAAARCRNPPVIFNFGDSNSDTGGLVAGLGFPVTLPNGRTFFRRSTGRLSDGRLLIDILCQSLNTSLLSPYLDSLTDSKFKNGANFAIVGSSTLPKYVPFSLNIQIMQFLHFKSRTLELINAGERNLINDEGSERAEIKNALKVLYNQGGRKFWIHNTGPLGCLPQKLSTVQNKDLDQHGCLSSYNSAAQLFNEGLNHLCQSIRSELKDASIVYVDIYSIKYDLIANSKKYGFPSPLMACCGYGGPPYNYNVKITCGHPGSNVCNEGSRFISWDGIHYTEAANAIIASKVLSMAYTVPHTPLDFFCRA